MKLLIKMKKLFSDLLNISQTGDSFLSLLFSLGLISILLVQMNKMNNRTLANRKHIELRKNKNDIKRMLLHTIDCKSFNYSCIDDDIVVLRNYDGIILINSPYSNYGRWSVRAKCQNSTPEIQFALLDQTINPANPPVFLKDPKTMLEMNWKNSIAVHQEELCRSVPNPLQIVVGARCDREARIISGQTLTGPSPSPWLPGNICNPNGVDEIKPDCPSGTKEWYSYWDRDDDWGKSGSWVVACR